jgi:hypothetical protein
VGVAASLLVSVAAYVLFETLLVFLFVPFVPFIFRSSGDSSPERVCPTCAFRTRSPGVRYCPRDGTELQDGN